MKVENTHRPVKGVLSMLAMIVAQNSAQGTKKIRVNSLLLILIFLMIAARRCSEGGLPMISSILMRL